MPCSYALFQTKKSVTLLFLQLAALFMWYKISLIGWSVLFALFVKALVLAFVHPSESQEVDPSLNGHRAIENDSTDLGATGRVYRDGRLWLDWEIVQEANNGRTSPQEVSEHGHHGHSKAHQNPDS